MSPLGSCVCEGIGASRLGVPESSIFISLVNVRLSIRVPYRSASSNFVTFSSADDDYSAQSDALVSAADEGGKCNPAAGGSSLEEENESPIAAVGRRRLKDNVLNAGRDSWYPRLLSSRDRPDSFPAGLEISAISVASLYDATDEIRTMDR